MEVHQRSISSIEPYGKNAKKHPEKQVQKIADSIREFGWGQPIVVDKNNVIIIGHGRYLAAHLLGMEMVPVLQMDIDEEKAKAYRLADNKLNESEWDMELVIAELKELTVASIDLTGFSRDLLLTNDARDDEVPEVPKVAKSVLGDVYELGAHRVICGDSTDTEVFKKLMGGVKADMCFTDPPYGVSYEAGLEDKASRMAAHRSMSRENTQIENDTITSDEGLHAFLLLAFNNIAEHNKHAVYICYASNRSIPFLSAFKDAGYHFASNIIWVKDRFVMGRGHYHYQYEPILYGWKEKTTGKWMGDHSQSNTWNFSRPSVNDLHPTMKPVELITRALTNSSGTSDVILDPFLGSGSTIIAAQKSGRVCYGVELDPKYVDVIVQRYVDFTGNTTIKKNGVETVW